jgi:hypothetical protein
VWDIAESRRPMCVWRMADCIELQCAEILERK